MPTNLRLATPAGHRHIAYFRATNGEILRVLISPAEYRKLTHDADDTKEYMLEGRGIRPQSRSKLYKAEGGTFWDTSDGFLQPGDYYESLPGELTITLPRPDLSKLPVLILEPGDWSGNPERVRTLNADVIANGVQYVIVNGVLV